MTPATRRLQVAGAFLSRRSNGADCGVPERQGPARIPAESGQLRAVGGGRRAGRADSPGTDSLARMPGHVAPLARAWLAVAAAPGNPLVTHKDTLPASVFREAHLLEGGGCQNPRRQPIQFGYLLDGADLRYDS